MRRRVLPRAAGARGGLYRFKTAFGADVVPRRSIRWTLRPSHVRAHRLARWVATELHWINSVFTRRLGGRS